MLDELRDRFAGYLTGRQTGVLCMVAERRSLALPVRFAVQSDLTIDCLLPAWSDAAFYLAGAVPVTLVVCLQGEDNLNWLQVYRQSEQSINPELDADADLQMPEREMLFQLRPTRLDRIDSTLGVQETLEL